MKTLIIVDMQNDFVTGSLAVKGAEGLATKILALATKILADVKGYNYDRIFFTRDWHPKNHVSFASSWKIPPFTKNEKGEMVWPDHCIAGTEGAQIIPELQPLLLRATGIINKGMDSRFESYSACTDGFAHMVCYPGAIGEISIVGVAFDYCVKATAIDLAEIRHPTITVIKSLTASVNPARDIGISNLLGLKGIHVI